jgi:predicted kinase
MTATVHLIHGFAGAGKTTFARRLEAELPAVRFTHDEWMHRLFGANPPADQFADLFARVDDLIWQVASRSLALDCDVVLDHGFWSRESRDSARSRVAGLGMNVSFYRVNCPVDEMERRVLRRTQDTPADSLWINQAALELFRTRFEPLEPDEERVEVDGTAAHCD